MKNMNRHGRMSGMHTEILPKMGQMGVTSTSSGWRDMRSAPASHVVIHPPAPAAMPKAGPKPPKPTPTQGGKGGRKK